MAPDISKARLDALKENSLKWVGSVLWFGSFVDGHKCVGQLWIVDGKFHWKAFDGRNTFLAEEAGEPTELKARAACRKHAKQILGIK